eukprot:COSAG02_NODE_8447_length_2568_cov_3.774808_2_plen_87_part_00
MDCCSVRANALLMAFGAGTYLWIGTVECFPCLMEAHQPKEIILRLMSFIFGVALIMLALGSHEHCEAGHAGEVAAEGGAVDPHGHG